MLNQPVRSNSELNEYNENDLILTFVYFEPGVASASFGTSFRTVNTTSVQIL